MVKVTCLLAKAGSGVGLSFGVRALTQTEIRCVKGMFTTKIVVFLFVQKEQSPEAYYTVHLGVTANI